MSKKIFSGMSIIVIVLFFAKCKVPYDPKIKSSKDHYLVVEGYINPSGITNIKLSRTRSISFGDTAAYINEVNAKVIIEDENSNLLAFSEIGGGNYSGNFNLNLSLKYRLHIFTADNREYLSNFVSCKISPIQNVGWKFDNSGNVEVFVNTKDTTNNVGFYRWVYTETWEFHSNIRSDLIYSSKKVIQRTIPVYVCYKTVNSSSIILGTSLKLNQDVINEAPVILIPNHDQRITVLYSTLVTQYALDSAGYNYWNAMKGNTQNLGSIFDSPDQTKGNVHCITDSTERVIGYVGAGTSDQQRIFISNSSMPADWTLRPNCSEKDVPLDSLGYYFGGSPPFLVPIDTSRFIKGYLGETSTCVDCSLTGSLVKPSFWP